MRMEKKQSNRRYIAVILVLLFILIMGIVFVINWGGRPSSQFVAVPDVRTRVFCENGDTHHFGARVVLEISTSAPRLSQDYLYIQIQNALSSLNYEDVTSFYGTEIARQAIRDALLGSLDEEDILGIFFPFILHDLPIPRN